MTFKSKTPDVLVFAQFFIPHFASVPDIKLLAIIFLRKQTEMKKKKYAWAILFYAILWHEKTKTFDIYSFALFLLFYAEWEKKKKT